MHLRNAADTVSILHPRIIFSMRFTDFALPNQCTHVFRDRNLPRMRPRLLNPQIEGAWCSHQTFQGHCAGHIGDARETFGAKQGEAADRVHGLGPVQ